MSSRELPDPNYCSCQRDIGRFVHDEENDIWYECDFDKRRQVFTWVIVPPADPDV
jgi:hypothetical protein